jgi:uroporphyrinogen decarboxylase
MSMTSKERVLCAIRRQSSDRVPVDFSANRAVLERLMKWLGVGGHRDMLEVLHVDVVDLRGAVDPTYRGPVPYERSVGEGVKENFWGMHTTLRQTAAGPEEMYCDFVLRDAATIADVQRHTWPSVDWFDFSDFADRLAVWSDRAVMASGASIWQHPSFLRGMDQLLMDLAEKSELGVWLLDKFTDFYVAYFDKMFSAAPGKIDLLRIADDIGMQDRLLISADTFAEYFLPRIRRLIDMAHSHSIKVMFHSCGSIRPLIGALIDAGVDVLDPVQVSAKDMNPGDLKRDFGREICFHGAIDTQYLLPQGSAEDVRATVNEMIGILGAGGGYILAPSHVLQTDVPLENIRALYGAAYEYGRYGARQETQKVQRREQSPDKT